MDKTKLILFKPRQKRASVQIRIKLNNKKIEQVKETIFLGVVLDECLTWRSHIAFIANKISKSLGIIHKASFFLNKQSLWILYFSMIYPYLQYRNLVWSNTYQTIMSRLQTLQKRIIRAINKSHFLAHTNPIFKSLYLLKLEDIRKLQISQFMFSIRNNLTLIGFQDNYVHS